MCASPGNFFFLKGEEASQLKAHGVKEYGRVEAALNILAEAGMEDSLPAHRLTSYRAAAARCGLFHANHFPLGRGDEIYVRQLYLFFLKIYFDPG